ncbi:hypothetical protein FN846DRAFT_929282 [Sphaerosporella brunnea]|uniref:Tyrosinase copper-binding domain-containing protein n=1 Tax=Sphaerosporella brunnea TaxID=1250544 RepID=A0A5J5F932_9PEZI|nr:hypothetical protein FN846DRAFT_929282 [Sphaerosporella brunnea]
MKFVRVFASLCVVAIATLTSASPATAPPPHNGCKNPTIRREWRTLSNSQKNNYLNAVKCLMRNDGRLNGTVTRYEDFLTTHQRLTSQIHFNGVFLPWHRLFVHTMEKILIEECGYRGAMPYWDMKRDAADFAASPVLNGPFSFGGNGAPNPDEVAPYYPSAGGPIMRGPFANEIIHIGVGTDTGPARRRIKRNIAQFFADMWLRPEREAQVLAETDFDSFSLILEGRVQLDFVLNSDQWGMHAGGHRAIGGDMVDAWTSPSDPLFYMHHSNLDRIWATWQKANPERQFLVGGPIKPRSPLLGPWPYPPPPGNVTLGYVMTLNGLGPDTAVGRVVDTMGKAPAGSPSGILCYQYDSLL